MRRFVAVVLAGASLFVIGVSSAHTAPSTTVAVAASAKQPRPLVRRTLPPLPAKPGTYSYGVGVPTTAGWRRVPADSPAFVHKYIGHPEVLAGINPIFDEGAGPITDSTIVVRPLLGPGTDTDTKYGYGAYSIQNNVFFVGSNDQSDSVQFTYQVGAGERDVCVWQVDIPQKNYNSSCVNAGTGTFVEVEGLTAEGLLFAVGAAAGGSEAVAVVTSDEYGLSAGDRWSNTSGSILGTQNGSEAVFGDKTEESIQLEAGACINTSGLFAISGVSVFCGDPDKLNDVTYTGYTPGEPPAKTVETNNLVPVIGQPPAALPTQLWFGNTTVAEISYVATTSGKCLSGSPPYCQ
jgi:hypothetical protein